MHTWKLSLSICMEKARGCQGMDGTTRSIFGYWYIESSMFRYVEISKVKVRYFDISKLSLRYPTLQHTQNDGMDAHIGQTTSDPADQIRSPLNVLYSLGQTDPCLYII